MAVATTIESRQYPLTAEVTIVKANPGIHRVFFGNTGLRLNIMQDSKNDFRWISHFTPDGVYQPTNNYHASARNTLIFGLGMVSLIDWWTKTQDWLSVGFPKSNLVQGIRGNEPMNRLVEDLLGSKDVNGFHNIKLDELVSNEQKLKRMERLKNRCLQRVITMKFPIGPIPDYSR